MRWNVDDGGRPATRRDWLRAALLAPGGLAAAAGLARAQQAQGRAKPQGRPAAPANAQAQPAPNDPKLDALLAAWEKRSKQIHTLDAKFIRTDEDPLWKSTKVYQGRALLKEPNFAFLDLQLIDPKQPKQPPVFADRIVCDGDTVYQYAADNQTIRAYPLPKNDRQRALEEGPLRFLFNMQVDNIKDRYRLWLFKELPGAFQLQIVPKLPRDRDAFSQAVVQINRQTFLPERMTLVMANKKGLQKYRFTSVKPNEEVKDENFQYKPVKGWKLVKNPPQDGPAADAAQQPPRLFSPVPGVR
ncbi:MAG TPA: TIGR03009 domain-containing protein [Isosphaeraceae bacterium]|jgi:TIGR03009 family protein|nr:TIGR03009 domain-containing protein [Isosphaeraceae bacterium]